MCRKFIPLAMSRAILYLCLKVNLIDYFSCKSENKEPPKQYSVMMRTLPCGPSLALAAHAPIKFTRFVCLTFISVAISR